METITREELKAAFEAILTSPPSSGLVRDKRTHSLGRVLEDLGTAPDEEGKLVRRVAVAVAELNAWHKKGDPVIWRDPVSCS